MADPLVYRAQPCLKCTSSDGLMVHEGENGYLNGYCHVCKTYFKHNDLTDYHDGKSPAPAKKTNGGGVNKFMGNKLSLKEINELGSDDLGRGVSKKTAEFFGVKVEYSPTTREQLVHYYPRTKDGKVVGYKKRTLPKKFHVIGESAGIEMFGQAQAAEGRKLLIIAEGELDGLSGKEMLLRRNKNYNIVATQTAEDLTAIKDNIKFIESHESVIFMLDPDTAGKRGAKRGAALLTPGKARIAKLPDGKDLNDLLQANDIQGFFNAMNGAQEFRPDGIVKLSECWDAMWEDENIQSVPYPWEGLNTLLYGMRPKEIVTLASGTGVGKSSVVIELAWNLLKGTDDNIGMLRLEEGKGKTTWLMTGIAANAPLHIREERDKFGSKEKIFEIYDREIRKPDRIHAYDHFGSTGTDNLINQVRYLIRGMNCKWILLDHLSIVVSSMDQNDNERRTIDDIMTRLRMLVEETGAGLVLVSHLRRPAGDHGHERGAEVTLNQLRGSHSIGQLSDTIIGLERDQQADDEMLANVTTTRVLKNRYAGITGLSSRLYYDKTTGRLHEIPDFEGWYLGEAELAPCKY